VAIIRNKSIADNSKALTTKEIEYSIAKLFSINRNIIVPNISWGAHVHECDMFILNKSGYVTEVEIKISLADLKKDSQKKHHHESNKIERLFFAIPAWMEQYKEFIPPQAGIILIYDIYQSKKQGNYRYLKSPKVNPNAHKFTLEEQLNIARLGCLRIWNYKKKIIDLKKELKGVKDNVGK
jgi:hypothetical protein